MRTLDAIWTTCHERRPIGTRVRSRERERVCVCVCQGNLCYQYDLMMMMIIIIIIIIDIISGGSTELHIFILVPGLVQKKVSNFVPIVAYLGKKSFGMINSAEFKHKHMLGPPKSFKNECRFFKLWHIKKKKVATYGFIQLRESSSQNQALLKRFPFETNDLKPLL